MPRVPVYEQQVDIRPLPNVRLEAGNAGIAGQMMGQALQGAGRNVAETAEILWQRAEEIKQEQDRTKALEILTGFRREKIAYLTDPEKGALNTRGAATRGLYQRGAQDLKAMAERFLGEAENPEQRAMLEQAILLELVQAEEDLSRHEAAHLATYKTDVTKQFAETTANDVIAQPSREKLAEGVTQVRSALAQLWNLPEDDPLVDGAVREWESGVHATIVKNLLDGGMPVEAKAWLDEHQDRVLASDLGTLVAAVQRGLEKKKQDELPQLAETEAAALLAKYGYSEEGRGQALAELRGRKDLDADQRLAVESRFKVMASDQELAQFRRKIATEGEGLYTTGGGWERLADIRKAIRESNRPQDEKDALISYVERRAQEDAQTFANTTAPAIAQGIAKAYSYHRMNEGLAQVDALEGLGQAAKDRVKAELKNLWAQQEAVFNQEQQDLYDATYAAATRQAKSYAEAVQIVQRSGLSAQTQDGILAHVRQQWGVGAEQKSDWKTEVQIISMLADGSLVKTYGNVWSFLEAFGPKLSDADKVTYSRLYEAERNKDAKEAGRPAVTFSRASAIIKLAKDAKITEQGELARLFDYVNRVVAAKESHLGRKLDEAEFTDTVEWALEKTLVEKRSALGLDWLAPDKKLPRYQVGLPPDAVWNRVLNRYTVIRDGKLLVLEFND